MARVISILAGGWSVLGESIDLSRLPGTVIGVNEAGIIASVDIIVSMDRLFVENRWSKFEALKLPTYLRRSAVQNIPHRPSWLRIFECDNLVAATFSEFAGKLNGSNSGFCAFNLAYQIRPKRIFLFGFDMRRGPDGEPYWHKPYAWIKPTGSTSERRYEEWRDQFFSAALLCKTAGIEVFNVSQRSAIEFFPKIRQDEI